MDWMVLDLKHYPEVFYWVQKVRTLLKNLINSTEDYKTFKKSFQLCRAMTHYTDLYLMQFKWKPLMQKYL